MKKITGFFLAILPLFITILLFATGFIVKQGKHIDVTDVHFAQESYSIKKENSEEEEYKLDYTVSPMNATNPDVIIRTAEGGENIIQVDNTGNAVLKGWGETTVHIFAKEDPYNIHGKATVNVYDDKYHTLEVKNSTNAEYLSYHQELKLDVVPHPAATYVKHDPTIKFYSTDTSVVEVAADGTLKAKDVDGEATIYIYNEPSQVHTEVNVRVNKGVYLVDFDNPSYSVVASKNISLADDLITYPDTEIASKPENFIWTSSNENVAKINAKGEITFLQPGEVDFTVAYKRNPEGLFTTKTKTIRSTCEDLFDVNFNRYNYSGTTDDQYAAITCTTYPESNQNKLEITSSDTSVITPVLEDGQYKFKINGAGKALLTASVTPPNHETITDSCLVTIKNKNGSSIVLKSSLTTDSFYYSLRDNLDLNSFDEANQKVNWAMEVKSGAAKLDEDNGIVHFTEAGYVKITATIPDVTSANFTLICTGTSTQSIDADDTVHLTVGTKYSFNDGWVPDFGSYADKFDIISDTEFIPKSGGMLEDVELSKSWLQTKYVNIIIEEKPISLNYETGFNQYIATAGETYNFKQTVLAQDAILPKTATKADGTAYAVKLEYECDPSVASVEEDLITFAQPGAVRVNVSDNSNLLHNTFIVESTLGNTGKFYLTKDTQEVYSGQSVDVNDNGNITLKMSATMAGAEISEDLLNSLTIETSNDNIEVKSIYDDDTQQIIFTISGKAFGKTQLTITNSTFTYTLNVNIVSRIEKFYIYYQGALLDSESTGNNIFFDNENIKLNVIIAPVPAAKTSYDKFEAYFDDQKLTLTEPLVVELDSVAFTAGTTHKLKLVSTDREVGKEVTNEFNLTYKDTIEETDFDLENTNGNVYMPATDTQYISPIKLNGFASDSFYSRFTSNVGKVELGRVVIDGIPQPTVEEPGYEQNFSLTYTNGSNVVTKNYHLTREQVARITFPKNDNLDETDAKGLQKVHMYGNQSIFKDKTEIEDYYKLEFNLYNFKGDLIEGDAKKTAFESLKKTIDQDSSYEYGEPTELHKEGFIKIKFSQKSKYEFKEIYDDAFAEKQNKNVTFSLSTYSGAAKAQYTFVATGGVNVYCEDGLTRKVTGKNLTIVLQTNFGKEGATKDNVPYETTDCNWLPNIVGNGYTINFNAFVKRHEGQQEVVMQIVRAFNTVIQGCNQSALSHDRNFAIYARGQPGSLKDQSVYYAYNEIKCAAQGIDLNNTNEKQEAHIKNCAFHNNLDFSIKAQTSNIKLYIENCVFYDCGAFGIFAFNFPSIYMKGMIDVYNFHNKEMLENIQGFDLSFAWNIVLNAAKAENVVQKGADTRDYINSFMAGILSKSFYFFDEDEGDYVQDDNGHKGGAEFIKIYGNVSLPFIGGIKLWSTPEPKTREHAPDYWDMYDSEGKIKAEFISDELSKIVRQQSMWELRYLWLK